MVATEHPPASSLRTPKVFGIGFHKTGTTSLAAALRILGYTVTGPNFVRDPDVARTALRRALEVADRFDGFQDNPWPILFRELDARYPGSRFVLTTRDPDRWQDSIVRHFGAENTPMRAWIYGVGSPLGNEAVYQARYRAHQASVRRHFRDRPQDLLEMDITVGEGWTRLAPFLGLPIPDVPFPHENARQALETRGDDRTMDGDPVSPPGL